jgi:hypothetical protein
MLTQSLGRVDSEVRPAVPSPGKEKTMPSLRSARRLRGLAVLALSLAAMLAVPAAATATVSGRVGSAPRLAAVVHSSATTNAVGGGGEYD